MNINGVEFTIGADPEVFVAKEGKITSAVGMVEGSKANPQKVDKGAVQVDGMALEFNIDPASSYEEFWDNMQSVQQQLADMIGDSQFVQDTSTYFEKEYLDSMPQEARELGCDPDFNAYTGTLNPVPDAETTLRTVGGHVHVGGFFTEEPNDQGHVEISARLAKLLDEEIGVYSLLWDHDDERRELYGKAGAFRPKTYGMEYRTLSNVWAFNEKLSRFVYEGVIRALTRMFDPDDQPNDQIENIINTSDRQNDFFNNNKLADEVREIVGA